MFRDLFSELESSERFLRQAAAAAATAVASRITESQVLKQEMAASRQSLDSDIITLRQIYVRDSLNGFIPNQYILISNGAGVANWNSVSSIYQISSFNVVKGTNGSTFYADQFNNVLNVSTTGVQGLLESYVDPATSTLMLSNAAPTLQVATIPVPSVTRSAAEVMPGNQTLAASTGQTAFKFLGVGDIYLSTVTDLRATFITISSFTSAGYADVSAEARQWRNDLYSTTSTMNGYATFVSSLPAQGPGWNWNPLLTANLPLSTMDSTMSNVRWSTGDVWFSTFSFNLSSFQRYINPNSTTEMLLEVRPSYFFPRMYLGTQFNPTLIKGISSFIQYETWNGPEIMPSSFHYDYITSQQSNAYSSNAYSGPLQIQMDMPFIQDRLARDGPDGNYTLYHFIPGGMAYLSNDGCDVLIGDRGGLSNPLYDNRTSVNNAVYLHVYNNRV